MTIYYAMSLDGYSSDAELQQEFGFAPSGSPALTQHGRGGRNGYRAAGTAAMEMPVFSFGQDIQRIGGSFFFRFPEAPIDYPGNGVLPLINIGGGADNIAGNRVHNITPLDLVTIGVMYSSPANMIVASAITISDTWNMQYRYDAVRNMIEFSPQAGQLYHVEFHADFSSAVAHIAVWIDGVMAADLSFSRDRATAHPGYTHDSFGHFTVGSGSTYGSTPGQMASISELVVFDPDALHQTRETPVGPLSVAFVPATGFTVPADDGAAVDIPADGVEFQLPGVSGDIVAAYAAGRLMASEPDALYQVQFEIQGSGGENQAVQTPVYAGADARFPRVPLNSGFDAGQLSGATIKARSL